MRFVTNLILLAIGIALVVYFWRGLSGMGWNWSGLDLGNWGSGIQLPDTRGMGQGLGCKWSGSC